MSEQTPETAATPMDDDHSGDMSGGDEPSMEDILASIRKIIADDPDPMPLDGPMDAAPIDALRPAPDNVEARPAVDLAETAAQAESDADALDLDALLNDIQAEEPETPPASGGADMAEGVPAFSTASPSPGSEADLSIPDVPEDLSASSSDNDEDDMDRLMNEMLSDMQDMPLPDATVETSPTNAPTETAVNPDEEELDLVKSLMADLTDDDMDTSAMLAVDPVVEAEGALDLDVAPSIEEPEADILDSILDMTLDDEIATGPAVTVDAELVDGDFDTDTDTVAAVAVSAVTATAVAASVVVEPEADEDTHDDSAPSLSDIAAAAEAEAVELIAEPDSDPVATLTDTDSPSFTPEDNQDTPALETPMPRAVRSDAILDDVTEEATMSAFAQLNQAVEDKAILSERGPRIGDLVQDALKPMLKEWLDENLQAIVERAVSKEVKRLSTGK